MGKTKVDIIADFLKGKYKAKTIIVVGSRAVGDYKPKSDWDLYIFTTKTFSKPFEDFQTSLPKELKHDELDIYLNSMDSRKYPPKVWRDLRNAKILFDVNDFGKKLVKKAAELYKKGPNPWTREYAQNRVGKAQRYINKFEDNLNAKSHTELFLRMCWHYSENVIEWWFGIRNEFPLRPQQAFPYIKEKDPIFYKQLQKVASDKTNYRTKINAFKKMHKLLFEDKRFKKMIK